MLSVTSSANLEQFVYLNHPKEVIAVVEVTVREGEMLERALRRFKKKWERAGVLREVKRKSFYIKPSDEKRAERKKTQRRISRLRHY